MSDIRDQTELLARMARLDARAGPGPFGHVQGGQVVREHMFTPAGLLIPSSAANLAANPQYAPWWNLVIPAETTVAPGAYL